MPRTAIYRIRNRAIGWWQFCNKNKKQNQTATRSTMKLWITNNNVIKSLNTVARIRNSIYNPAFFFLFYGKLFRFSFRRATTQKKKNRKQNYSRQLLPHLKPYYYFWKVFRRVQKETSKTSSYFNHPNMVHGTPKHLFYPIQHHRCYIHMIAFTFIYLKPFPFHFSFHPFPTFALPYCSDCALYIVAFQFYGC